MVKITGMEAADELPPKVLLIYEAVEKLIAEGEDINSVQVSAITKCAGIGKGTAYDYFETKDELLACALLYQIRMLTEELDSIFSEGESFAEQIRLCMEKMQEQNAKQKCFIRYVHIMTANSNYCQLIREKMSQKECDNYLPMRVFREAIMQGMERGEIKRTIPLECAIYALFSKLLIFLISMSTCAEEKIDPKELRSYLYQSLLDELCEKNV